MTLSDFLLSTTIRIETVFSNGVGAGTGFFFNFCYDESNEKSIPAIVTNKHVVKDAIKGKLRFSLKEPNGNPAAGKFFDVELTNFENLWIMHPDPNVDLCIFPIASIHKLIQNQNMLLDYTSLTIKDIPSDKEIKEEFSRVEEITVVGYPDGIWDSANNMPVVRRGITATSLQLDFNKEPKFLVDAAIYGGSSGSPVFIFNQGSFSSAKGGLVAGSRLKLVGIIFAVAQHNVNGEIKIVDIPASKTPVVSTMIPNNLGVAIHARKLMDFEDILRSATT